MVKEQRVRDHDASLLETMEAVWPVEILLLVLPSKTPATAERKRQPEAKESTTRLFSPGYLTLDEGRITLHYASRQACLRICTYGSQDLGITIKILARISLKPQYYVLPIEIGSEFGLFRHAPDAYQPRVAPGTTG